MRHGDGDSFRFYGRKVKPLGNTVIGSYRNIISLIVDGIHCEDAHAVVFRTEIGKCVSFRVEQETFDLFREAICSLCFESDILMRNVDQGTAFGEKLHIEIIGKHRKMESPFVDILRIVKFYFYSARYRRF